MKVFFTQQGSRENYHLAHAFKTLAEEYIVYTDFFNKGFFARLLPQYTHRFHPDLASVVKHQPVVFFKQKLLKKNTIEMDEAYDKWLVKKIEKSTLDHAIFFTYSYSAYRSLQAAKNKGWTCIVGQINPGPKEADMVAVEYQKYFPHETFSVPDKAYWKAWEHSLNFADALLVNSEWSKSMLGDFFPREKMHVLPLVMSKTAGLEPKNKEKIQKIKFVYLGALSVRKGFHYLQEALKALTDEDFELHIVGRLNGPASFLKHWPKQVHIHGHLNRQEALDVLSNCDIFINPTLSDGFALTQLEACAAGLPSIFTPNCAQVYTNALNGLEIEPFSAQALANAMRRFIHEPNLLSDFRQRLPNDDNYSFFSLKNRLQHILHENITRS